MSGDRAIQGRRRRQTSGRWRGAARWLAAAALAAGSVGSAAARDYDPAAPGWNAIHYLTVTAAEADVALAVADSVDFATWADDEARIVVAPQAELTTAQQASLRAWVVAGGRLVLADDFRAGQSWLRPFGLRLVDAPTTENRYLEGRAAMPILPGARLDSGLGFQVDALVLNHPAALVADDRGPATKDPRRSPLVRPVVRYADGVRALVVEVQLGRGRVLALADPSVLIDSMLRQWHGNKQFAANVLRWGCQADQVCAVTLHAAPATAQGQFEPRAVAPARGALLVSLDAGLRRIGELLRQPGAVPLGWLLTLAAALWLPWRRSGATALGMRLPQEPPRLGRRRAVVEAWLRREDADFRQPARLLAQRLARLIAQAEAPRGAAPQPLAAAEVATAAARLVDRGRLTPTAATRVADAARQLDEASESTRLDRQRFAALAAEVEWAEHVLSHTSRVARPRTEQSAAHATIGLNRTGRPA